MNDNLRYVFDTNVLLSAALFFTGRPNRALDEVRRRGRLLMSLATSLELKEVLSRPKFEPFIDVPDREDFLNKLIREAVAVEPIERIRFCRDPRDDKFLEVAVTGRAACLVTGDSDLLTLNPFRGIPILTPTDFLASLPMP